MGARGTLAACALAAALVAGCGDKGTQEPRDRGGAPVTGGAAAPDDRELLGRLLTRRARALAAGDGGAYGDTASGGQVARDREALRNLDDVPLADARYEVSGARVGERRATLDARLEYRIRGIRGTYSAGRRIVAVKRRGEWRVRREGGARDRAPWEVGPYRAARTEHFTILAPEQAALGGLPGALEAAYDRVRRRIVRPRARKRYLVVVAADARAARRLTTFIQGTSGLAAITDAKVRDDGPARQVTEVVSIRLLVILDSFAALAPVEQERVITHELAHAVLTGRTSGRTPAWLTEGVALYLSEDRRVAQAAALVSATEAPRSQRRALTLTGLSAPDAIARLDGPAQAAAYAYASSAAHYLAARFSERRLLRLYEAFNDPEIPGEGGAATTDAAVRRVLRRPLADLERDLRRWIVTRAVVEPFAP